jgi:hypothetical protein
MTILCRWTDHQSGSKQAMSVGAGWYKRHRAAN